VQPSRYLTSYRTRLEGAQRAFELLDAGTELAVQIDYCDDANA
jgi:hypothetical protein